MILRSFWIMTEYQDVQQSDKTKEENWKKKMLAIIYW